MDGGVGAAVTVMRNGFEADRLAESVTFTVKSNGARCCWRTCDSSRTR